MAYAITVNGTEHEVDLPGDVPLLWVLRDALGLTGTKFGCGVAACGACTVHVGGVAVRSCQLPVGDVWDEVTTMQAAALLSEVPVPTDAQIDDAMAGNLCRCGTYPRIRAAIKAASATTSEG